LSSSRAWLMPCARSQTSGTASRPATNPKYIDPM
jgi:hypothetical protein